MSIVNFINKLFMSNKVDFIPSEFVIANQKIKITIKDKGEQFGLWDSLRNEITLYLEVKDDDNNTYVVQTREQLMSTYWHELFHCFNFFYNTECSEELAQSFSNLMCQYEATKIYNT